MEVILACVLAGFWPLFLPKDTASVAVILLLPNMLQLWLWFSYSQPACLLLQQSNFPGCGNCGLNSAVSGRLVKTAIFHSNNLIFHIILNLVKEPMVHNLGLMHASALVANL